MWWRWSFRKTMGARTSGLREQRNYSLASQLGWHIGDLEMWQLGSGIRWKGKLERLHRKHEIRFSDTHMHSAHTVEYESFSSVQFSRSVVSDSLQPCGLQQARPPCPSPTPGVYSNSCPLSRWYYPTISSSVIPFSSCLQSFPASGSLQMSQLFASGGQIIGSFSFGISPSNEYSGLISFSMDCLDLFAVQRTLKSLLQHNSSKASVL